MCLCHGSLTCVYRLIHMTTAVQEGSFSLLVSFDRLLSGSHLLNYSPCPSSAGAKKIYHKDLPILHSASNSSVVSTERNVKLSKMSYSFLCPSFCQALHLFYSNHSLPQMLWQQVFCRSCLCPMLCPRLYYFCRQMCSVLGSLLLLLSIWILKHLIII